MLVHQSLVIAVLAMVVITACRTDAAKPHILLMVLDDIGRTDTGIYGPSNIPMPNLNALAKNGVVLENFYTQTVCSPTRSSLLTGQYPFRFGMQHYTVSDRQQNGSGYQGTDIIYRLNSLE